MSVTYEILVAADASPILLSAMRGFEVRPSRPGETRVVGDVVDDAALQALLQRLQSLRVALLEDRSVAGEAVADAIALAEVERLRRPFLDVPALGPLLHEAAARPGASFEQSIVAAARARSAPPVTARLVEPLSRRELDVLVYLPTRLSNEKIAIELYVSTNTVKSHVSSIYRKLGVSCRDDAVQRAGELGLL